MEVKGFREAKASKPQNVLSPKKQNTEGREGKILSLTPRCWPSGRKGRDPVKPVQEQLAAERERRPSMSMDAVVAVVRPNEGVRPEQLWASTEPIGKALLRVIEPFSL